MNHVSDFDSNQSRIEKGRDGKESERNRVGLDCRLDKPNIGDIIQPVPCNPLVRPDSNKTSKQHDILMTRGSMKTLAI